jgi:SAM-dependent methyltransferase
MNWDAERYQANHNYVWQYGAGLLELLEAKPDERILDLGCGTGQLTAEIAKSGADVVGLDRSLEMIAEARRQFPEIRFVVADAANAEGEFDAVFSNAALHWMKPPEPVAAAIARCLKRGGRFVAEFGGKGNVQSVLEVARQVLGQVESPWYYPSIAEYTSLLERHGLETSFAMLFDRPTPLTGESGMADWLRMFAGTFFAGRDAELERAVELLRPRLFRDGVWLVDYRRLRVVARQGGRRREGRVKSFTLPPMIRT